ncbi:unnamed protein product [Rhizopus stolonifer]
MSSPLPVNAKKNNDYLNEGNIAGSFDHSSSTAKLGTSIHSYLGTSPAARSIRTYGSTQDRPRSAYSDHPEVTDEEIARAVKRHLVSTSPSGNHLRPPSVHPHSDNDEEEAENRSVHQLPGGAITHDIYKWTEQIEQDQARKKRSRSVMVPRNEPSDPALVNLKDPGGFRRHFVIKTAAKKGKKPPSWITHTFVDFLALYGHFGGED